MKLYHPLTGEPREVPDIDAPGWMRLKGYLSTPPSSAPAPAQQQTDALPLIGGEKLAEAAAAASLPQQEVPDALRLINGTDKATDLEILPTVGRGAAKKLLAKRPEGGYTSLDQVAELCPEIFAPPYTGDLAQMAAWGAE